MYLSPIPRVRVPIEAIALWEYDVAGNGVRGCARRIVRATESPPLVCSPVGPSMSLICPVVAPSSRRVIGFCPVLRWNCSWSDPTRGSGCAGVSPEAMSHPWIANEAFGIEEPLRLMSDLSSKPTHLTRRGKCFPRTRRETATPGTAYPARPESSRTARANVGVLLHNLVAVVLGMRIGCSHYRCRLRRWLE